MYANNIDDFWFDFSVLWRPTLLAFLITFLIVLACLLFAYLICFWCKKPKFYDYILTFATFGFVYFYIQGNFLAGFLPSLDGETIEWNNVTAILISAIIFVACLAVAIVCCIKIKSEHMPKVSIWISASVFAMLIFALGSTMVSNPAIFEEKTILAASSEKNLNLASSDRNFMIFLVDAVDSYHFNKIVNSKSEYADIFRDFSYFPDTLSGYAFTRDSVPFIFSGSWNLNEKKFAEYSTTAFNQSEFFNTLAEQNYNMNFYNNDFVWMDEKAFEFSNIISISKKAKTWTFIKQELKYTLFKYLPYSFKRFSSIGSMNFNWAQNRDGDELFNWSDTVIYNDYLEKAIEKIDEKYFQYIHIEGGHVPFNVSENVELLPNEDGTYEQKLEATMKIIKKYIERLKKADVYDNSTIIILADHGFWYEGTGRQNPILYIKGVDEKHNGMIISEKQISYEDLCRAFIELLEHKSSTEIFENIPTDGRVRRYIYNGFNEEEHMYEYEQTGKAWNNQTLIQTGRSFDL